MLNVVAVVSTNARLFYLFLSLRSFCFFCFLIDVCLAFLRLCFVLRCFTFLWSIDSRMRLSPTSFHLRIIVYFQWPYVLYAPHIFTFHEWYFWVAFDGWMDRWMVHNCVFLFTFWLYLGCEFKRKQEKKKKIDT